MGYLANTLHENQSFVDEWARLSTSLIDAQLFKSAFEDAQKSNAALVESSETPAATSEAPAAAVAPASTSGEVHGDKVSAECLERGRGLNGVHMLISY